MEPRFCKTESQFAPCLYPRFGFEPPPLFFAGSLMPLFRACCYSLFRHSCLLIAFMQTLP